MGSALTVTPVGDRKPCLLLCLFVLLMLPAITAVLVHAESIRVIFLVFHAGVVATLTAAAGQRDDDSVVLLGQGPNSYNYLGAPHTSSISGK